MQPKSNIAAFFDFDDTLIDINSSKIGFKWLRENKMLTKWYLFKITFFGILHKANLISEKQLANFLITFYEGKNLAEFATQADKFYIDLLKPHLVPNIVQKLENHKKQGHIIVMVSGSIRYYLEPAAKDLGIHHIICTDLEEGRDGLLTGKPIGKICIGDYKRELTLKLVEELNIDLKNSYAYGDNQSDIPLLKLVGNPVAVEPTPKLEKHAKRNNWTILNHK